MRTLNNCRRGLLWRSSPGAHIVPAAGALAETATENEVEVGVGVEAVTAAGIVP